MFRCIELARKGAGYVAPNPMVGAVLVQDDQITGEGWHACYGQAHAEVGAIGMAAKNGKPGNGPRTLYVSLEPCAHWGKTPPCADLIIRSGIQKVVIGCRDPFEAVNGKGIEKLRAADVEVVEGVLEKECRELNKRFFTFHEKKRPYIILKWAQTADGFIAFPEHHHNRLMITNPLSNRLVHQWRSEEAGILVGTRTALADDPLLTNRLMPGPTPLRMVLDMQLRLPGSLKLLNRAFPTLVFNGVKEEKQENLEYCRLDKNKSLISQLLPALYERKIQSVLVEGGRQLLQTLLEEEAWDEARILTNSRLYIGDGLRAPVLSANRIINEWKLDDDMVSIRIKE